MLAAAACCKGRKKTKQSAARFTLFDGTTEGFLINYMQISILVINLYSVPLGGGGAQTAPLRQNGTELRARIEILSLERRKSSPSFNEVILFIIIIISFLP